MRKMILQTTSSSGDDASSNDDLTGEVSGGGFEPPIDLKADARLDSLRRDNAVLQEIVRRQDQVLEEMDQRIREIQAATAQRQAELQALRAARARREAAAAAAAAEEVTTSEQEKKAAKAARALVKWSRRLTARWSRMAATTTAKESRMTWSTPRKNKEIARLFWDCTVNFICKNNSFHLNP